jgi:hypothetical protein
MEAFLPMRPALRVQAVLVFVSCAWASLLDAADSLANLRALRTIFGWFATRV